MSTLGKSARVPLRCGLYRGAAVVVIQSAQVGFGFQAWLRHDEVAPISDVCRRNQILHHWDRQQGGPPAFGLEQVGHEEHLRSKHKESCFDLLK